MKRPPSLPELSELLSMLCEDTISDTQFARLNEILESDVNARAYYAVYMDMHCGLCRQWGLAESVSPAIAAPHQVRQFPRRRWTVWASVAALIALTSVITLSVAKQFEKPTVKTAAAIPEDPATEPELMTNAVAMLSSSAEALWADNSTPHTIGAPLSPGWLRLKSGTAAIQFYSGATVVLQGTVEFRIVSTNEAFCQSGRLSAEVPPQAQGFHVGTPHLVVTDLGTAFGLDVSDDHAEVHVLKGKIALSNVPAPLDGLNEGEAVSIGPNGSVRRFAARPDAFVTTQQIAQQSAEFIHERTKHWLASADLFNSDPSLQVHFDFEKLSGGGRILKNLATNSSGPDGVIVGCGVCDGRWTGKGALEFRTLSDRVRVIIPGEYQALTLSTWVRVDSLDHLFSSLLMVDAYNAGAFHWQIAKTGKIILGVAGPQKGTIRENVDYATPIIVTPDRFGRWMHLAIVYDSQAGEVRHYLDGNRIAQLKLRYTRALQIGNCELGNWSPSSHVTQFPFRYLNGCMDEFSMHSRAFTDAEITQLYALGVTRPSILSPEKK